MIFTETPLASAMLVDLDKREDERGFFARYWCGREFADHGIPMTIAQANTSLSRERGTLRGMHHQLAPRAEAKLIRCLRGAIYDVIVDVRPDSPTHRGWFAAELTAENRRMLYVPEGFAHGFLTLADDTEVLYLVSESYSPAHERGVRYDDPAFAIDWPFAPLSISDKDRSWPDYAAA